jgi:hypothetical protein
MYPELKNSGIWDIGEHAFTFANDSTGQHTIANMSKETTPTQTITQPTTRERGARLLAVMNTISRNSVMSLARPTREAVNSVFAYEDVVRHLEAVR